MATVYLLCFAHSPYKHAKHYLGATRLPLEDRLNAHRRRVDFEGDQSYGRPAKLLQAALAAGCDWILADVWECASREEAFALERRLKAQGGHSRKCSICNPGNSRGLRIFGPRRRAE